MSATVRAARPGDATLIFDLVCELAVYEKLEHEVEATPAMIAGALFSEPPRLFCDIAEWNGEAAGLAVWFYNFSTFRGRHGIYLEDLFMRPAFRGKGLGKALLRRLAQRCIEENLPRLQWAVLDWNRPSLDFYERLGAESAPEWISFSLAGEALERLATQGGDK